MSEFKTIFSPTSTRCPAPLPGPRAHECEFTLNIGLFFDGTDNNKNYYTDECTNTNIARLWHAYRHDPEEGFFSYYVSGVGTPFTELGKTRAEAGGGPAGAGGEARIVYGLLQVVNAIHLFTKERMRLDEKQLAALCSETRVADSHAENPHPPTPEQKILAELGLSQGLVGAGDGSFLGHAFEGERHRFFRGIDAELRQQLATARPRIASIYLDVFGFSRGAAQARVFVAWLHELLLMGGQLFGVPAYVRMLGLFDTVASVGVTDAVGGYGHGAWATVRNLRIHALVRNCVHHVALHELRTNFPLDSVQREGQIPPNCEELHSPGVHSDVGGGYAPGEQGKGVALLPRRHPDDDPGLLRDDGLKLSNLTLNRMLAAAKKTCEGHPYSPWIEFGSKKALDQKLGERFGLDRLPEVRGAVAQYFAHAGVPAGLDATEALRKHGLRYLAWRFQVSKDFMKLPSVKRSMALSDLALDNYLEGQKLFELQSHLLSKDRLDLIDRIGGMTQVRQGYHAQAPQIYGQMKRTYVHPEVGSFFDAWVHDSYAGFIGKFTSGLPTWATITGKLTHRMAEAQGYVRWRGLYGGSDERLNADAAPNDAQRSAA